jgi:hypothetical protein
MNTPNVLLVPQTMTVGDCLGGQNMTTMTTKSILRSQAPADPLATTTCNSSDLTQAKLKTVLNVSVRIIT